MNEKLDRERELFRKLPIEQLEMLAAESQALVNKAMGMVRENSVTRDPATSPRAQVDYGESNGVTAAKSSDRGVDEA
jgi:hypothetical protein